MADIPKHHRAIFHYLLEQFGEPAKVVAYRNNDGKSPIAVGEFGPAKKRFYSTIGICDKSLKLPAGKFEFATMGNLAWLPNALASSVYWLRDRASRQWPVVCEDVVRQNAKSRYRHMAFISSQSGFKLPAGFEIKWLLGVPITDSEISLDLREVKDKAQKLFPAWMLT